MPFILTTSLVATIVLIAFACVIGCLSNDDNRRRGRRSSRESQARTRTRVGGPAPLTTRDRKVSRSAHLVPPSAGRWRQGHLRFEDIDSIPMGANLSIKEFTTAEDLRAQAMQRSRMMYESRELAKAARKRKDHAAEDGHNREAVVHEIEVKNLNKAAAELIFQEKNKGHPEGTVDLHGLYVEEAVGYATHELKAATRRSNRVVYFIVGKGLHAKDGKAKIRPALEQLCQKRKLTYSLDPKNAGVLIVQC
ncbi:hypothetical protein F5148DRAFT_1220426 [Russula earlei]|uniref:Uncharacterized protein n=1 Tax=Russula earlei TaxID=71964 RepID=A0ACC0U2G2_9AGAM|nr:hypothetical protein F5148DRAFT_1220426 [Russula earlei]